MAAALADRVSPRLAVRLRASYAERNWDPEIRLLPRLVDARGPAVDVGANQGVYTWPLSRLARKTYAVEANPELAKRLRQSFGPEVEVLDCALSDDSGSIKLWIPMHGGGDLVGRSSVEDSANPEFERRPVEVEKRTLDSLDLEDCGFIKLHVEGHELAVLRGGRRTIERCRPTILTAGQVRFTPDLADNIAQFLQDLGYTGYFLRQGRLWPYAEFDPAVHQRPDAAPMPGDRKGLTADFIYNFIYVHPSRSSVMVALGPLLAETAKARQAA